LGIQKVITTTALYTRQTALLLKSMERQLLYSENEYARVKWFIVSSGREGTLEDILCVTREGIVKAAQIQEQLHLEGILDLNEVREYDE
jgi:hypothetical protein